MKPISFEALGTVKVVVTVFKTLKEEVHVYMYVQIEIEVSKDKTLLPVYSHMKKSQTILHSLCFDLGRTISTGLKP